MMEKEFNVLLEKFSTIDNELFSKGQIVHNTEKGIWGAASLKVCFELFKKMNLSKFNSFLDLGCGDGRIALLASLFTKATGIEYDGDLVNRGVKIQKELGLDNAKLIQGDYFDHNISSYDIVFINPDTGFYNKVEEKLLKELNGVLLNYNKVFLPRFLKRGKTHWIDDVPITEFSHKEN